jgi:WD40 repeat protein
LGVEIKFGQACETPAIHVAFSPNGEYVLFVSERNEVLSYHIRTGRFCRLSSWGGRRFISSTVDLHVHPQTGPLLLAAFNGTGIFLKLVRFLQQSEGNGTEGNDEENMRRDRILNIAFSNRGSFNRINDFRLSHCSQHAVAGGVHGYVQLWKNIQIDTAVNNDNSTLPEAIQPTMESIQLHGPSSHVISVAFSPDGEWVAAAEMAGTIKVWHVPTSSALHVHPKASLCDTSYCKLESAASINVSAESTTLPTLQPTCINTIRFTPDSAMLAATGNDGTIRFWCRQSWTGSSQANQS